VLVLPILAIDYSKPLARDHRTAGVNWRTVFELQRSPAHEFDWQSTLTDRQHRYFRWNNAYSDIAKEKTRCRE